MKEELTKGLNDEKMEKTCACENANDCPEKEDDELTLDQLNAVTGGNDEDFTDGDSADAAQSIDVKDKKKPLPIINPFE